jgi:hypothetical protein
MCSLGPPAPPSNVVNHAEKTAAKAMSDSDTSPAPTPAELAAQQVADGHAKAMAESLQFTGKDISLEKRIVVQTNLLALLRSSKTLASSRVL